MQNICKIGSFCICPVKQISRPKARQCSLCRKRKLRFNSLPVTANTALAPLLAPLGTYGDGNRDRFIYPLLGMLTSLYHSDVCWEKAGGKDAC